jgi:dihydroorotate dehydrogenase (NAD+) catalytic subunit
MEGKESLIRWSELVAELASYSNMTQLGRRIDVSQKEVGRWTKGTARPQGRHADSILKECDQVGINWRKYLGITPIYDFRIRFDKNVLDGPQGIPPKTESYIPRIPTRFLGYELNSPFGVPASVLTIDSKWIEPLTNWGFDIITAKTVRTRRISSHPLPNCVYLPELQKPLRIGALPQSVLGIPDPPDGDISTISMANSFGMPSPEPHEWQEDLQTTKQLLKHGQILIASVVGTAEGQGSDSQNSLVNDFVKCAKLAHEAEPHAIELNFSCPNVYGNEGSIYHDPDLAARICKRVSKEIPDAQVLIKVGYLSPDELARFFDATYRYVSGYTAINTLPAKIISEGQQEEPVFPGSGRTRGGVSGVAIRDHALEMVKRLRALSVKKQDLVILGVGGISSVKDVKLFQDAGADGFQICTATLLNPFIAVEIRKQLALESNPDNQSHLLEKVGLHVPFVDPNTAKAFDLTLNVSQRMRVPFEIAYEAVRINWLDPYLKEIATINQSSGAPQKTRRNVPTEVHIEGWVKNEVKKNG